MKATIGRPRAFDPDEALDRALEVFWRRGYEGASLTELTAAMGINKPSLYATFGDKEALFRKALDRYESGPASYVRAALEETSARAVAEALLLGAVEVLTNARTPGGCLVVQGALTCGESSESIRQELERRRVEGEAAVRRRFKRAKAEGDLPKDASPADLSRYVVTVLHGLAVQAKSGATRDELKRVVRTALRAWPS